MNAPRFNCISPKQAVELQRKLRERVVVRPLNLKHIHWVAGADLSYDILESNVSGLLLRRNSSRVYAGVVVLSFPGLELVEQRVIRCTVKFPYIPGLLSFRESPAIVKVWSRLGLRPDVLLVDGHGRAHPRRFGIACHLGILLGVPTVGCGKSILVGDYSERKLGLRRGSQAPLIDAGETVGIALRTRAKTNPIFVSVGHRSDLATAKQLVLDCSPRFRIPEPTRRAHFLVNAARRGEVECD